MYRNLVAFMVISTAMPASSVRDMEPATTAPDITPAAQAAQSGLQSVTRPRTKARDADQAYLRALADHFDAERLVVHAMMSTPASHASHGTAMDPGNWDTMFDGQQNEARTLLKHDYREELGPVPTRPSAPLTPARADAEANEEASMQSLIAVMRQGVVLCDRFMPRLRRASSRDLARRVHSSHVQLIKELGAMSGH